MGGVCSSCDSAAVASAPSSSSSYSSSYSSCSSSSNTAKLIFPDGRLQEYQAHMRVSRVLQKAGPDLVLCSADDVSLEGRVPAVGTDDELRPGQLYFVFPSSILRRRLQPQEIAELAVRASAALAGTGWSADDSGDDEACNGASAEADSPKRSRMRAARTRGSNNGRGRDFSSDLGAIEE